MDIRVERCLRENSVRIELLNQRESLGEYFGEEDEVYIVLGLQ